MNKRLFVQRKTGYQVEAETLRGEFNLHFNIDLASLRYYTCYDMFNLSPTTLQKTIDEILVEPNRDELYEELIPAKHIIAIEYLPGQFDQRADALMQCIRLLEPTSEPIVFSGYVITFDEELNNTEIKKIKNYLINPVESRIKDLSKLELPKVSQASDEQRVNGFITWNQEHLEQYLVDNNLSMSIDDLLLIQEYFINEKRDPYFAEVRVLDTYWSDHCRHTTFETILSEINFSNNPFANKLKDVHQDLLKTKASLNRGNRPLTLMEMATINKRLEAAKGRLNDLEQTDEINAVSVEIDVDVNKHNEKWLFMFKNETHNHPTEIEPFGGASTCVGGAIRDPLSGRSYVHGGLRITGAADILAPIDETLPGKLPQRLISKTAALGFSSYGNQIGVATPYVREIFHPDFVAKRMELGAVYGAARKQDVVRAKPTPGDKVILIGGRTGRDGIGGATGSSKEHTKTSIETSSSEVQKGNAPEERKIQRLFRNPEVSRLIKKANDFGAGGVSVAVGELADGLDIYLEKIRTKYDGISGLELAISESQERMAVVVSNEDVDCFLKKCEQENLEAYVIADVTALNRMRMLWRGEWIVDLHRDFINSSGVRQSAKVSINHQGVIPTSLDINRNQDLEAQIKDLLNDANIASLQGLDEMFDATIGAATVLSPYGGRYKLTKVQGAVQRIPVIDGKTTTTSIVTYGYNPFISKASPFHGATYAILESLAKIVALGGDYTKVKFSFQEYFERLGKDPLRWGKPYSALLGAYSTLKQLGLASIGGKDSMSGTFHDIDVPPTLVSFAFAIGKDSDVISPELKAGNNYIYAFLPPHDEFMLPDINALKAMYQSINELQKQNLILSSCAIEFGGIMEALIKMSFGNRIGFAVHANIDLLKYHYGGIIVESKELINDQHALFLGKTHHEGIININGTVLPIDLLVEWNQARYKNVYPITVPINASIKNLPVKTKTYEQIGFGIDEVRVLIPVFPGTNCEYDTKLAFTENGGTVEVIVINTLNEELLNDSIDRFVRALENSHILSLVGGFSLGDEPDGSGKFMATFLRNEKVRVAIERFLNKKHLILGICNGFQALIKSGLLPYGRIDTLQADSPTLFKNHCNRHVAKFIMTKTASIASPWLSGFKLGEIHSLPISHGEGRLIISEVEAKALFAHNQIACQYVDELGNPTMDPLYNPNGSHYAIESIISLDGLILGKMAHSERYQDGLYKNIHGNKNQNIFKNAINYFRRKAND